MTEPTRPAESTRPAEHTRAAGPAAPRGGPSRRWKLAGIAGAVAGVLALGACSHGPGRGWDDRHAAGQMDPERAARFTEKMADRVVSAVDGTPEQRQKIAAIARDATQDLSPLRERVRAARRQSIELLGAATIDRAAIERLRAEQVGLADTASKRLAQALADTAEVLTPEQRVKLAERMNKRMGRWS